MPADAHAAPKVSVPVIYREHQGQKQIILREVKLTRSLNSVLLFMNSKHSYKKVHN
jgi:hypothetical protein